MPSKNTCNVSGLTLAARLTAATGCCLLALMRSEFYVVAHDPFGSEQGTLSLALLASHLVIFFWFNPRSDRALNPQRIRRTAAGPRHVREQGAAGAQLEVFLVWLDKSKMFVPTPPLPDCLPLPLCVRRASAQARTLRGFTFYWTGGKTRQDFCPVSCHGPKTQKEESRLQSAPTY